MSTLLGLDLGIKTGALVRAKINEKYNLVEKQKVLYSWTRGPMIKSSLDQEILKFFNQNITSWLRFDLGEVLVIDWDISEIYWGANKRNTNTITFIAGYITALAHRRGIHVLHLSPKCVREFFGFNGRTHKNEVQRHFLHIPRIEVPMGNHYSQYKDIKTDHELDALILAYVGDLKLRGKKSPITMQNQW